MATAPAPLPAPGPAGPAPRLRAFRHVTAGSVAVAAFTISALSGLALLAPYDAHEGARSITAWFLAAPGVVFLRNVHHWTAQLFLVAAALHGFTLLRTAADRRLAPGIWRRAVFVIPVAAFLLLSGFLLRGDAEARATQQLLGRLAADLPFIGPALAAYLFVGDYTLPRVLFHHAVTAPLLVGLVVAEYARRRRPRPIVLAVVAALVAAVALFVSPGLHDGLAAHTTGPWYLSGLELALRALPSTLAVVALLSAALGLVWALPRLPALWATPARRTLVLVVGGYALLCVVAGFWERRSSQPACRGDLRVSFIAAAPTLAAARSAAPLALVRGRHEGCLVCHGEVTGLGDFHRPASIGCASCHLGDTATLDAARAHAAMIRVPGNLADAPRTCGSAGCHADIVPRVDRSIMSTFSGVIAINRRVFGEPVDPAAPPPHVRDLGHSASDSHVRQLCASCHLGQEKTDWGPIVQESRGGGCNACHLVYSPEAKQQLLHHEAVPAAQRKTIPTAHPSFTVNPGNDHCFGCHSRSGRISTNYEGWHELHTPPTPAERVAAPAEPPRFRELDDGRFFVRMTPDVHQTRGLDCIDCHTSTEVMGGGTVVRHKNEQVQLRCQDCHARPLASQPLARLDAESHKLLGLRQWSVPAEQRFGTTRTGGALVNVFVAADGSGQLRRKRNGQAADLRAPLGVCTEGSGHDRLSCAACHTPWAPRCTSCHTKFDPAGEAYDHVLQESIRGAWTESSGPFETAPPTLGIRLDPTDPARPAGVVDTFVPGMIMELDRNRTIGGAPDPVFRRLYGRTFAHTITREARSCQSCHNDPIALGYGRGDLRYTISGATGHWQFTPAHAPSPQDGLPADAWIGFQQPRTGMVSTRDDVRPFNVDEQRRILRVGACLTCHAGDRPPLRDAVADFPAVLARRSQACVPPAW